MIFLWATLFEQELLIGKKYRLIININIID